VTIWYRPTCVCASAEPVIRPASTMPAMSCFIVTAVFASENTRGDLSAKVRARTSSSAIARSRGPAAWSNFVGSSDEVGLVELRRIVRRSRVSGLERVHHPRADP